MIWTRTWRTVVAAKFRVTVLLVPGANDCPAAATIVVNPEPFVLPCTVSVCVRVSHAGGSLSTTWSTLCSLPRSTCAHCGNAPALSQ
ncbi:hypothetical protein GCM10009557_33170 [Virgisporangium ochraceum]